MNFESKLILGNTYEILKEIPSDLVDVGVTSPPYNKGEKHKGWLVKNVKYDKAKEKRKQNIKKSK